MSNAAETVYDSGLLRITKKSLVGADLITVFRSDIVSTKGRLYQRVTQQISGACVSEGLIQHYPGGPMDGAATAVEHFKIWHSCPGSVEHHCHTEGRWIERLKDVPITLAG